MSTPGFTFHESVDRRVLIAPGIRLGFFRQADRWTHVLAPGAGSIVPLRGIAYAVEGDAEPADPARVISPTYQEIEPHPDDRGLCALLTGRSAAHHFSAVVTVRRDSDSIVIDVDVADRCRSPLLLLASTYLVRLDLSNVTNVSPARVVWGGDELGRGRLEFSTQAPNAITLGELGRRATGVQALARIDPTTFTQRLAYRWRWSPPGGLSSADEALAARN